MRQEFDILGDVAVWLGRVLGQGDFSVIVTVERKATALMRALIEMGAPHQRIQLGWSQVVSSDAVSYLGRKFWTKQRVLVFNELIHTGKSTDSVVGNLRGLGVRDIQTSAYGVHADMENSKESAFPDFFQYRHLDDSSYSMLLARLVEILHRVGGLLLDTEHIELPVTLHCPVKDFFRAFELCGDPIRLNAYSAQWADCLTVADPVILDAEELAESLPEGADLHLQSGDAVRKLRVVPRGMGQFVVVPIWYPSVPRKGLMTWKSRPGIPDYVRSAIKSYKGQKKKFADFAFSLTTLVASLSLLKSAVAALYSLGKGKVSIGFPPKGNVPLHVEHLHAVYPTISLPAVAAQLSILDNWCDIQYRNQVRNARGLSISKPQSRAFPFLGPEKCQQVRSLLERRLIVYHDTLHEWQRELSNAGVGGKRLWKGERPRFVWKQMMDLARGLGVASLQSTAAMDLLIDDATLVTTYVDCGDRIERGYGLAAEEVCSRLRDECMAVGMR